MAAASLPEFPPHAPPCVLESRKRLPVPQLLARCPLRFERTLRSRSRSGIGPGRRLFNRILRARLPLRGDTAVTRKDPKCSIFYKKK